jgi:NDP-sugar pyrophosphorylase family protein
MLRIAGKPILEHNIRLLTSSGIEEIAVNTHHRPEAISEYFGDGAAFGVRMTYSHEVELHGTAGALLPLCEFLSSTFLVLYGDNLTTCDLPALFRFHHSKGGVASLAVYRREGATAGGIVAIGEGDRIERFLEKPGEDQIFSSWVNAGIMVCEPSILERIPSGFSDFGKDVIPKMISDGAAIFAYRMADPQERLWWIDSPEDYERTKADVHEWDLH